MNTCNYDLVVIGGGPAGMAAAIAARQQGIRSIVVLERDKELGGILNQCIHNGFGLHRFGEELTGPEYSTRIFEQLQQAGIDYCTENMVLKIADDNNRKVVHVISPNDGYRKITAKAVILAMGCRERTRGAINLYGSRPAGIYTAGTAQRLINMDGYMPGKIVVILGSGDIGLIMARRMTLEGAKVVAVVELLPHSNGLTRNIVQCLDDYQIPLLLSHTVVRIHGHNRVTGVTIAKVDEQLKPLLDTERFIPCDTLLLSVGLVPENEISRQVGIELDKRTGGPVVDEFRQTNLPGIFACGNVVHVHDLVDFVSEEGAIAGIGAAKYIQGNFAANITHTITPGADIGYVAPQHINVANIVDSFKEIICICCPLGCNLRISERETGYVVAGNKCPRGKKYALDELAAPQRIITSTVKIDGGIYPVISVKTAAPIPKNKIFEVMHALSDVTVIAPIKIGDIVLHNVANTGVAIVATKNVTRQP